VEGLQRGGLDINEWFRVAYRDLPKTTRALTSPRLAQARRYFLRYGLYRHRRKIQDLLETLQVEFDAPHRRYFEKGLLQLLPVEGGTSLSEEVELEEKMEEDRRTHQLRA